jgi:hypothetical protein
LFYITHTLPSGRKFRRKNISRKEEKAEEIKISYRR